LGVAEEHELNDELVRQETRVYGLRIHAWLEGELSSGEDKRTLQTYDWIAGQIQFLNIFKYNYFIQFDFGSAPALHIAIPRYPEQAPCNCTLFAIGN
jgi:hypothetical protein